MLLSEQTAKIKVLEYQSSNVAESGTTTTNITIIGHGLITGDFIVNTTRRGTSNLDAERGSRKVTRVDDDNLTITPAISGQTTADTILLFSFVDRTEFVKDGTLNLSKKVENESGATFQMVLTIIPPG